MDELAIIFSGKRSAIFTNRNEQLIKELVTKQSEAWKPWIPKEAEPLAHETEVCCEVTWKKVIVVINTLKQERAPGVDGITAPMLRHAGPHFITRLTDLVNSILSDGVVPESLLTGKMTLIDKKSPSLLVNNKRPLTVSSAILSCYH